MNDINQTVENFVNNRILANFENIMALNEYCLEIIMGGITIFLVILGFNYSANKRVISSEIKKQLAKEKEEFKREAHKDLKKLMNQYRQKSQKEEFLRNMIFKDLIKILSSELQDKNFKDITEKFNLHAERLEVITQLTSGNEEEVIVSLKRLATRTYDKIIRLQSFRDYIQILENQSRMYIKEELATLRYIMSK